MDLPPIPVNTTCESYYQSGNFNLSLVFLNYFTALCIENQYSGGASGTKGIDEFLGLLANEYFTETKQIVLLYDESWDISDMILKLTLRTNKAFVSYFLPQDETIAQRIKTSPSDHFTHKLLPKADAFMVFVKDEYGFENILKSMSAYPWWNKRARLVIMAKDKSSTPTKGILALLESEKIFNGVVVTEITSKENATLTAPTEKQQKEKEQGNQKSKRKNKGKVHHAEVVEEEEGQELHDHDDDDDKESNVVLQVVALDPYPEEGHTKETYVGRWINGELQQMQPIFQDKITNLRGHRLQVCTFEFPPLVIKTMVKPGKYEYSGLEVNLLQELARILNFTYEFFEPPEGERWGSDLGNNTWTGLIGETQRHADFGFASVFLLDNREKAVDVSTPYDQDQGCFAVPRPEKLQHWLGLVLPFSWQVWACVIAMAIVAGPTFSMITRPLGMDRSMTVGRGIMYALGSLVSAQKAPAAKSNALRSFIVSWLIFCWLACILYRVALIVSLTLGPSAYRIDTLKQLARSGLEWGGYPEAVKTFSNTSDTDDEKLFERFQTVTNVTAALERVVHKGDFALMDSGKFLRYLQNERYFDGHAPLIHVTKECPTRYNVGFIMPIGSPFLEKVNELIHQLKNAGIIDKWYNDIIHLAAVKNPSRASKGRRERGLDIGDLKLCFVLILCGHFTAFLVMLGEHGLAYYRSGKVGEVGSNLIRRVSTMSGLSSLSSRGGKEDETSVNPSVIITETDDNDGEPSSSKETLRSLPVEIENGWCQSCEEENGGNMDTVSASLGDIKAISCPHIVKNFEE